MLDVINEASIALLQISGRGIPVREGCQRFLCKSSLRKGNGKISHISSPPFHGEELQPFLHFSISALPEWLRGD